MQPNPEHAHRLSRAPSTRSSQQTAVTVIDDLIHGSSLKVPLAGTARWSSAAQLGSARGCSASPTFILVFSRNYVLGEGNSQGWDANPMPDRHFSTLQGWGRFYTSISPLIELFAGEGSREMNTYFLEV